MGSYCLVAGTARWYRLVFGTAGLCWLLTCTTVSARGRQCWVVLALDGHYWCRSSSWWALLGRAGSCRALLSCASSWRALPARVSLWWVLLRSCWLVAGTDGVVLSRGGHCWVVMTLKGHY